MMGLSPAFGARFEAALGYACRLHATQLRKGSDTPYVAHLLAVTAIVIENGGAEDEAIAALLHDAIEDQGGEPVRREIEARFGANVLAIVEGCTDTDQTPKPPWRARKEAHLARLERATSSVALVAAADKLHNLRSLVADYAAHGDELWSRFNGGQAGTLWYYQAAIAALRPQAPRALIESCDRELAELTRLVAP